MKSILSSYRDIFRTRKYLSVENTKTLVHAFVTCRLDNGNALLYGLPTEYLIAKLQVVLNCAARLILCKQLKYDHATPLLIQLHCLPVIQRIILDPSIDI